MNLPRDDEEWAVVSSAKLAVGSVISFLVEAGKDLAVTDNSLTFVVIESSPILGSCGLSRRLAIIRFPIQKRWDMRVCFHIFNQNIALL